VRLRAKMQDLSEMSMINVCKDAEELAIDVFDGGWKRCVERLIGFGWEHVLVFNQSLEGGQDGVDVGRRGERNNFAGMVDPWVVQRWAAGHCRT